MSRLQDRLQRMRSSNPISPVTEKNISAHGLPSNSRLVETEEGAFVLREIRYPLDYKHGNYVLSLLAGVHAELSRVSKHYHTMKTVDSHRNLLFFDTETTGLGVGAGNTPFMIGIGYYSDSEFISQQLFMRNPGEERAMLIYFQKLVRSFTHLVSYNGRTFDWPIIKNRFVLNRISFVDDGLEQLDLLYISRHLWKNSIVSCRLSNVEEQRLGIRRNDDVSGSLAPAIYFQYLVDGIVDSLEGVFRHNDIDVLTLATLTIHLGKILTGELDFTAVTTDDLLRIGIWLDQAELPMLSDQAFTTLLRRPPELRKKYASLIAAIYKKKKDYQTAVPLWEEAAEIGANPIVNRSISTVQPLIELAMYYEHQCKEHEKALFHVEEALNRIEKRQSILRISVNDRETMELLHKRRTRLMSKIYRNLSFDESQILF